VKKKSGSLEPDLLVVAVVTVLIRGSNRCGEFVKRHATMFAQVYANLFIGERIMNI